MEIFNNIQSYLTSTPLAKLSPYIFSTFHQPYHMFLQAEKEEVDGGRPKRAASAGVRIAKSHQLPLTAKLSRTTRRNYHNRCNNAYVSYGTGSSVRRIGDKTSFNIHLNKDQIEPKLGEEEDTGIDCVFLSPKLRFKLKNCCFDTVGEIHSEPQVVLDKLK
ncbi:hypothetical protein GWK47_043605 [Chionoecetes opilio]|uniref:Uncharacterized protein n=1 Tax=Chionoecetes opilio TaxID=41210 RepID=A0A8J4YEW2_CHIOP|nr:hypothetical protein GWK47_043605 [Chionoecetes opilio]